MIEGEDRSGKRAHAMQRLVTLRGSDFPTNLQKREKHCYSSAFPVLVSLYPHMSNTLMGSSNNTPVTL